jgi:hypothetical protein
MRFESAIISISQMNPLQPKNIPDEIKMLAQTFKGRSRLDNIKMKPEDLVVAFMNLLVIASEAGIDLESKTIEVLNEIEQPSFFGS